MSKETKVVYFVRHGQSEDNVAPVFQGLDSPLSAVGQAQAKKIAARAANLKFEAMLASPLPRARQTAEAIARATGKNPEFSDLFVERIKPTSVNGKPYTDQKANDTWRQWTESLYTPGMRVEDGENFDDIVKRADRVLQLLKQRPEQRILVVTHGLFLRTLVARVLLGEILDGSSLRHFHNMTSMDNTALSALRYEPEFEQDHAWRLWIYNDHAHLA
ncbi:MAG TPA: histidine phosphatase family protein [Candidatus Saccharimonadales bacterium]|nr:histidine phosphatase family protein [Candidatus Saccharimonadales bacterium]